MYSIDRTSHIWTIYFCLIYHVGSITISRQHCCTGNEKHIFISCYQFEITLWIIYQSGNKMKPTMKAFIIRQFRSIWPQPNRRHELNDILIKFNRISEYWFWWIFSYLRCKWLKLKANINFHCEMFIQMYSIRCWNNNKINDLWKKKIVMQIEWTI